MEKELLKKLSTSHVNSDQIILILYMHAEYFGR